MKMVAAVHCKVKKPKLWEPATDMAFAGVCNGPDVQYTMLLTCEDVDIPDVVVDVAWELQDSGESDAEEEAARRRVKQDHKAHHQRQ